MFVCVCGLCCLLNSLDQLGLVGFVDEGESETSILIKQLIEKMDFQCIFLDKKKSIKQNNCYNT